MEMMLLEDGRVCCVNKSSGNCIWWTLYYVIYNYVLRVYVFVVQHIREPGFGNRRRCYLIRAEACQILGIEWAAVCNTYFHGQILKGNLAMAHSTESWSWVRLYILQSTNAQLMKFHFIQGQTGVIKLSRTTPKKEMRTSEGMNKEYTAENGL